MRAPDDPAPPSGPAGLSVLAVEDHGIGRTLLAAMLAPLGLRSTIVPDGRAALAAARAERFDVVLLDLGLPDIGGERLAHHLARTPGGRHARLVAMTGRARPAELPNAFHAWLEKPFSVRELHALLAGLAASLDRAS